MIRASIVSLIDGSRAVKWATNLADGNEGDPA